MSIREFCRRVPWHGTGTADRTGNSAAGDGGWSIIKRDGGGSLLVDQPPGTMAWHRDGGWSNKLREGAGYHCMAQGRRIEPGIQPPGTGMAQGRRLEQLVDRAGENQPPGRRLEHN